MFVASLTTWEQLEETFLALSIVSAFSFPCLCDIYLPVELGKSVSSICAGATHPSSCPCKNIASATVPKPQILPQQSPYPYHVGHSIVPVILKVPRVSCSFPFSIFFVHTTVRFFSEVSWWVRVSTWWNLEPPWKQISGHVYEELFRVGSLRREDSP